jgi:ABC-type dipeptide/oligopeptide/nickel transport system ATPase component
LFETPLHPYTRMLLASAPRLEPGPKRFSSLPRALPESQAPLREAAPGHYVADLAG